MKLSRRIATIAATGVLAAGLVTPTAHAASSEAVSDASSKALESIFAEPESLSSFVGHTILDIALLSALSSLPVLCSLSSDSKCAPAYTRGHV